MRIEINEPELLKKMIEQNYNKQLIIPPIGITIDSRLHKSGDMYIPLVGDNFDGHDFISQVLNNKPSLIVSEKKINLEPILNVKNNREFIRDITTVWRNKFDLKLVGFTGSNGKTTTKDLAFHVISPTINCFKTKKNYNTVLSSPLSFLSITKSQKVALIEMGTNQPGEIKSICDVLQPNIGLITNISNAHTEKFNSKKNIAIEKSELFNCLSIDGIAIINSDDPFISEMKTNAKKITYGFKGAPDFCGEIIEDNKLVVNGHLIHLPYSGFSMAQNSLAVFALSSVIGISTNKIINRIENFILPKGRGQIINKNGIKIIDDSYNANPTSMITGLNRLIQSESNRKIAILGDMFELGNLEKESHEKIANYLLKSQIDIIILIGKCMKNVQSKITKYSNSFWFESNINLIEFLNNNIEKGDLIYVKGSRGMEMENIIEGIN
jgi:UDP-N-acetylmuramoyl-tripeptide--D-alanyl-D-alanine ligase